MKDYLKSALKKTKAIEKSDFTIYDQIEIGNKEFWLTSQELQAILNHELAGINLFGLPLRTRSKRVKSTLAGKKAKHTSREKAHRPPIEPTSPTASTPH